MVRLAGVPEPERTIIADLKCPSYALLDKPGPVLEDFLEEAPYPEGEAGWKFPGDLDISSVIAEETKKSIHNDTQALRALDPFIGNLYLEQFHHDLSDAGYVVQGGAMRIARTCLGTKTTTLRLTIAKSKSVVYSKWWNL
jgi:hypothetical protein